MRGEQFNARGVPIGRQNYCTGSGDYRVVEYRAYSVDHDRHFVGFEALVCAEDAEAIEKASRLADRHAIELWSSERFVTRLEAKTK